MYRLIAITALLVGCGNPPVEAPAELNELLLFVTTHFDDDDTTDLHAGILKLNELMGTYDLEGNLAERAFTLAPLDEDSLGGMPTHAGYSPEAQVPVGIATLSAHDLNAQLRTVEETNHVCIESASTKFYRRTFDSDLACFLDHSCDTLKTSNEVRKETAIADVWYDLTKQFRWLTLENGDDVLIARTWAPDVFATDGGGNTFDQTYILDVWYPAGVKTRRFIGMWSSITHGLLGDDAWSGLVRSGIDQAGGYHDDYLADFAEGLCNEDRDRAYDRP